MKICCLIDSLGSGGAQRQMTALIGALTRRQHDVRLVTYFKGFDHFLPDIRALGIEPENVEASSKFSRFRKIRSSIRKTSPDCIISFLNTPNLIGVFSSLPPKRIPIIVSERSLDIHGRTRANSIRFNSFRLADRVVTNSQAQANFIATHFSFLKRKTEVIPNCVNLEKFRPRPIAKEIADRSSKHILVAASVIPVKNTHRFVQAIKQANDQLEHPVIVDWFGNNLFVDGKPTPASKFFLDAKKLVADLGVEREFRFYETVSDIHERFSNYDAVCLPSVFEGCPNIVCEAMASGKPVLASNISDLTSLIDPPDMLFEPTSIKSIAATIQNFATMSTQKLEQIGKRNRAEAESCFAPERFADRYEKLIQTVVGKNLKSAPLVSAAKKS